MEQAQAHFGQAMRLAPHLFEPAFNGGLLAFKLGEFQDSFELANKALEAWEKWDYHVDHTTLNSSFLDVRCASMTCFVILEYRDVKW